MIILRKRTAVAVLLVVAVASHSWGSYSRGLEEEEWTAEDEAKLKILTDCVNELGSKSI